MMEQEIAQAIRVATEATLRTVAGWGEMCAPESLNDVADLVALGADEWGSCPVCEEIECDDGCPLAPVRNAQREAK